LIEIRGQIARKLKFLGQLGVKLTKFTTKDQSAKGPKIGGLDKIWGSNWRKWKFNGQLGVKLHKSKTKDYAVKDAQTWGSNWSFGKDQSALNQKFRVN